MPVSLNLLHHYQNQKFCRTDADIHPYYFLSLRPPILSSTHPSLGHLLTYALCRTSKPQHFPLHTDDSRLRQPGPRLLEAYLSVFYRHATLDAARVAFWNLFEDLGLEKTPRIYVEALERCGNAHKGHERQEVVGSRTSCGRRGKSSRRMRVL